MVAAIRSERLCGYAAAACQSNFTLRLSKLVIASEAKQSPAIDHAQGRWLEIASSPSASRNDEGYSPSAAAISACVAASNSTVPSDRPLAIFLPRSTPTRAQGL